MSKRHNPALERMPSDTSILLIEDDVVCQMVIKGLCKILEWNLYTATKASEAFEIMKREHFDIILMDIQMPEINGIEATKIIRDEERRSGGHIPIIATTAYTMEYSRESMLKYGMDDYISKPIDFTKLVQIIEKWIL
ncbi:MAG: response regulator [Clostridiales bacterium]|nr:response regulator [Clostridiales bacterium]